MKFVNVISAQSEMFQHTLKELDLLLTGKSPQGSKHYPSIENFIQGELFYLSDGGYSRLNLNWHTGKIGLASESRDEVKERFYNPDQETKTLIEQLQLLIDKFIEMGSY